MSSPSTSTYAIILAAGRGTRMSIADQRPDLPKVLRRVCGRALIQWVLDALKEADIGDIAIVIGAQGEKVREALGPDYRYVVQPEQLGSGHAVSCAASELGARRGIVVIMCGDSPLFKASTIRSLISCLKENRACIALACAVLPDPAGYGRIIRDPSGRVRRIVEDSSASAKEKAVREVNGGCYAFDSEWLWANIGRIEKNAAGELNLTDLVRIAISDGETVTAIQCEPQEILGVNSPEDLVAVEQILCSK